MSRLLSLILIPVTFSSVSAAEPSFLNDVLPILTRQGCNSGACHGKGSGQNGFRLSLRGYAPESDHRWITREFQGRRIDPAVPEQSILLTKPTGAAPHDGGKLLNVSDPEYQTLLNWIRAGAPGPNPDDPTLTQLDITPTEQTLVTGEAVQLQATARFSDGSSRDVSRLTTFASNDASVISVTPTGLATAQRGGATAVRAAFQSEVAVAVLTVPFPGQVPEDRYPASDHPIDDAIFDKLQALNIEPSPLAEDAEFLRRVFLDTIGTLPTPDETRAFLVDTAPDKRTRLIDSLLKRPEWVDYWTLFYDDLLQNRVERDHDVRGIEGVKSFHAWIRERVERNQPWDEMAREVLTSAGPVRENPAIGYYIVTVGEARESQKSEVVASVAQAFLGTRIGCAECHNHPLERYTQDDYYHFAGYFSRIKLDRQKIEKDKPESGNTVLHVSARDEKQNDQPVAVRQPRTGQLLEPRPLDRSDLPVEPGEDPRVKLAAWMTDPSNQAFSGAMVNRIWKHFMGVGLIEPVDDLRVTNPPSNPRLWAWLNREFVESGYDVKHLMRQILESRVYQLSSRTLPGNQHDTTFHSHYIARRLPAEVFLDAIAQTTGIPDSFPDYPAETRAIQVPDTKVKSDFLEMFGKSKRVTACACERDGNVTLTQLLHLRNGQEIQNKIRDGKGRLTTLLRDITDDAALIDELYLSTLSRHPTAEERDRLLTIRHTTDQRDEFYRDLFWALLNSKDFAFNH